MQGTPQDHQPQQQAQAQHQLTHSGPQSATHQVQQQQQPQQHQQAVPQQQQQQQQHTQQQHQPQNNQSQQPQQQQHQPQQAQPHQQQHVTHGLPQHQLHAVQQGHQPLQLPPPPPIGSQPPAGMPNIHQHLQGIDPQQAMVYWQLMQQTHLANQQYMAPHPAQPVPLPTQQQLTAPTGTLKTDDAARAAAPLPVSSSMPTAQPSDIAASTSVPAPMDSLGLLHSFFQHQMHTANGLPPPPQLPPDALAQKQLVPPTTTAAGLYIDPNHAIPSTSSQPISVPADIKSRIPGHSSVTTAREKNRMAQQRFRQKQKDLINKLKDEKDGIQAKLDDCLKELVALRAENGNLREENSSLRAKLAQVSRLAQDAA